MRKKTVVGILSTCAALLGSAVLWLSTKEKLVLRPVEELKVRITSTTEVPDPANVQSAGDWYFLDHISNGLAFFDADTKKFSHLFAESWSSQADGTYLFTLRPGIKFHDGTPISAKDVVWSLKRQLMLKTSTHFPLWDYIVGCEGLDSLENQCPGLFEKSDREIVIRLKAQTDSFFLQLASPETGVWWSGDMNPQTGAIKPTKFSGAYFVGERTGDFALLRRNSYSPLSEAFPDSPRSIRLKKIPLAQLDEALLKGEVDLAIRSYNPLGERDWKASGLNIQSTTPSTILYLFGLGLGDRAPLGRDLIEALWRLNKDRVITPSESFLPFANDYGLSRTEFLSELPEKTAKTLRILCPEGFFSADFLSQIQEAAASVGARAELHFAGQAEFFAAFNDPKASNKYDYVLSSYAASERYPAVQLRYLTKKLLTPPIDLKPTESPDININRVTILKDYQKWLLQVRQAIPIYFNVTLFIYQKHLDIGHQSTSDAEIELWRVRRRGTP